MNAVIIGREQDNVLVCISVDQLPVVRVVSKQEGEAGIPGIYLGITVILQSRIIKVRNIKTRSGQPDILIYISESIVPFFAGFRQAVDEEEISIKRKIICQRQIIHCLDRLL